MKKNILKIAIQRIILDLFFTNHCYVTIVFFISGLSEHFCMFEEIFLGIMDSFIASIAINFLSHWLPSSAPVHDSVVFQSLKSKIYYLACKDEGLATSTVVTSLCVMVCVHVCACMHQVLCVCATCSVITCYLYYM